MSFSTQISLLFRNIFFGKTWTAADLKTHLEDISWEEATTQVNGVNSIATLVYHMTYYIPGVTKVLEGGPLETKDADSFKCPPINSQEDWNKLVNSIWPQAETFANLVATLPDEKLLSDFVDPKYGNYYRNLHGLIEHLHYHLGQIVILKKILRVENTT